MRSEVRWQVHRAPVHLCCLPQDNMSGFENNPFAEPVDVNPFQVNIYLFIMSSVICKMLKVVCAANLFDRFVWFSVTGVMRLDWQAFDQSRFTVRLASQSASDDVRGSVTLLNWIVLFLVVLKYTNYIFCSGVYPHKSVYYSVKHVKHFTNIKTSRQRPFVSREV